MTEPEFTAFLGEWIPVRSLLPPTTPPQKGVDYGWERSRVRIEAEGRIVSTFPPYKSKVIELINEYEVVDGDIFVWPRGRRDITSKFEFAFDGKELSIRHVKTGTTTWFVKADPSE